MNKVHLTKLKKFGKQLINICEKAKIKPILYGSYMIFYYTKDKSMRVNDLDFYIKEKDFSKLRKSLENNKLNYEYSKDWHTLQVKKGKLKIEFDSIDFWYKGSKSYIKLNFEGKVIRALSLDSLRKIYKRASETSKDNPEGNLKKYQALLKIDKN